MNGDDGRLRILQWDRWRELGLLMTQQPRVAGRPARLPDGLRVYAVGDVHGRLDLLQRLEAQIAAEAQAAPRNLEIELVYLGDYVDRGPDSRGVIELLASTSSARVRRRFLCGNHDQWFRDCANGTCAEDWLANGGDTTLRSYGVELAAGRPFERATAPMAQALRDRLPRRHRIFLDRLDLIVRHGDYVFCHAGVSPGRPLDRQSAYDLLWTREPFLSHHGELEAVIVHGHTVSRDPVVRTHRIGVDTGAVWTGRLTAAVLEGAGLRFISTADTVA